MFNYFFSEHFLSLVEVIGVTFFFLFMLNIIRGTAFCPTVSQGATYSLFLILGLMFCRLLSVSDTMASPVPLSKANTSFCLDLFKQLSDKDKAANVFFSPFSISSALAMLMLGTRGNTHTQMSEVQHARTHAHTHTHTHTRTLLYLVSWGHWFNRHNASYPNLNLNLVLNPRTKS